MRVGEVRAGDDDARVSGRSGASGRGRVGEMRVVEGHREEGR
jgi:hypothetical protein